MWTTEMVKLLRNMVGDTASPYKYDDNRLQEIILLAAQHVSAELDFSTTYVVDIDELTLEPDPTDREANTRDNAFINLVTMKAACIIDQSEARTASAKGISIRDGDSAISTESALSGRLAIFKLGWCAEYSRARDDFVRGNGSPGAIILGPYRALGYAHYSYPIDGRYR